MLIWRQKEKLEEANVTSTDPTEKTSASATTGLRAQSCLIKKLFISLFGSAVRFDRFRPSQSSQQP